MTHAILLGILHSENCLISYIALAFAEFAVEKPLRWFFRLNASYKIPSVSEWRLNNHFPVKNYDI